MFKYEKKSHQVKNLLLLYYNKEKIKINPVHRLYHLYFHTHDQ